MKEKSFLLVLLSIFLIQCVHSNINVESAQNDTVSDPSREPNSSTLKLPNPTYQTCHSDQKLYLENDIIKLSQDLFVNHDSEWDKKIPIQCIQFAQMNYGEHFAYCKNENDQRPKLGVLKPCRTENYTKLVYNAYHDVKDCFGLDPKSSFLQIMIESGFHINALNKKGRDAGVTQFTKNGIQHVLPIIERTTRILSESSKPSCDRIASAVGQLDPDAFELKNRCVVMALPKNPYRGFLMHYLHTLKDQIQLKRTLLNRLPEIEPLLSVTMMEHLVYFSYNRGVEGTLRLLEGYVKNRKAIGAELKAEDFNLWQNLAEIRNFLKQQPDLKKQLSKYKFKKLTFAEFAMIQDQNYMANMTEARDLVKSVFGDLCSY